MAINKDLVKGVPSKMVDKLGSLQVDTSSLKHVTLSKAIERILKDNGQFQFLRELIVLKKGTMGEFIEVKFWKNENKLTWISSDPSVATVSTDGFVKPKTKGRTVITATNTLGHKETCEVYVVDDFIGSESSAVGKGIDITKANAVTSNFIKFSNTVYDIDLLNASGKFRESKQLSNYETVVASAGKTVSEAVNKFSSDNKFKYQGSFSASADVNYKKQTSTNIITGFARVQARVRTKDEWLLEARDLQYLHRFVTDNFKKAVNDPKATGSNILDAFGTHVIARCYWGGLLQVDFITSSTKVSTSQSIEAVVKASAFGASVSSANVSESQKADFRMNSTFELERYGGNPLGVTTIEQLKAKFSSWVNSVSSKPVVCGIDELNELENMIPIWKIAELINKSKADEIKKAFDKRLAECQSTLNNIKIYNPVVTALTVTQCGITLPSIPEPWTHVVLALGANRNNHRVAYDASTDKGNSHYLDCNKGADGDKGSSGQYIPIFYQTKQITNYKNMAISDIIMIDHRNPQAPAGYTKIPYDLNAGCGGKTDDLWLCYKKAASDYDEVIDFIGGYYFGSANLHALPPNEGNGRWEWVMNRGNSPADLNQGAGGTFIRLIVHKLNRAPIVVPPPAVR